MTPLSPDELVARFRAEGERRYHDRHPFHVAMHAGKLSRPLLIIHGITDDNVHFANSLALVEAMYVAGKFADFITLSATHMVPDPKLNLAREQVQIDFFRQHLGPPP